MSRYYYDEWAPYVSVAERRRKAEREMKKRRKKGHAVSPVTIAGRAIATSFWGKAWCRNLEGYGDYESRLPRGRTYVRNGSVIDLQIAPLEIRALVSGSSIYEVTIAISAASKAQWRTLCRDCAGAIDSLVELLQGRFSKAVMERICRQDTGLFPKPSEIRFRCSCPDAASMCKHVAAVLYGVGSRLDERPELLFQLRAVDGNDLTTVLNGAVPLTRRAPEAGKVLEVEDIAALFGLDMGGADEAAAGDAPAAGPPPRAAKGGVTRKPVGKARTMAKAAARRSRRSGD